MVDKRSHIELYEPKSEGEWSDFAKAVAAQISRLKYEESKNMNFADFLCLFMEKASAELEVGDMNKLSAGVFELNNAALEAEKKAAGIKKKKKTKYVSLDGDGDFDDYDEDRGRSKKSQPIPEPKSSAPVVEEPAPTEGGKSKFLAAFLEAEKKSDDEAEDGEKDKGSGKVADNWEDEADDAEKEEQPPTGVTMSPAKTRNDPPPPDDDEEESSGKPNLMDFVKVKKGKGKPAAKPAKPAGKPSKPKPAAKPAENKQAQMMAQLANKLGQQLGAGKPSASSSGSAPKAKAKEDDLAEIKRRTLLQMQQMEEEGEEEEQ